MPLDVDPPSAIEIVVGGRSLFSFEFGPDALLLLDDPFVEAVFQVTDEATDISSFVLGELDLLVGGRDDELLVDFVESVDATDFPDLADFLDFPDRTESPEATDLVVGFSF